jgi:hypothetical protein
MAGFLAHLPRWDDALEKLASREKIAMVRPETAAPRRPYVKDH